MGGEGSIARSFMVLSFLTAALLLGVQGMQDVTFRPHSQVPHPPSPSEGGTGRSPFPSPPAKAKPFPLPASQAREQSGVQAGGAGGGVAPAVSSAPSPAGAARPDLSRAHRAVMRRLSLGRTPATSFVPAIAQLPTLLNALPDQIVQVIVDLSDRQVYLYQGVEEIGSYPVAIGKDGWETPAGQFRVVDMQVDPHWQHPITRVDIPPGPDNPLGSRWIAFLPMEDGVIGFHGTYQTELIGQAVSHGCIRMRNADIEAMYDRLYPGAPVIVRP